MNSARSTKEGDAAQELERLRNTCYSKYIGNASILNSKDIRERGNFKFWVRP